MCDLIEFKCLNVSDILKAFFFFFLSIIAEITLLSCHLVLAHSGSGNISTSLVSLFIYRGTPLCQAIGKEVGYEV